MNTYFLSMLIGILFVAILSGCTGENNPTPPPTQSIEPTSTPAPTNTPEPTDTPLPTSTPEPTATATAIALSEEESAELERGYRTFVLMQFALLTVQESASQIAAGEVQGMDTFGYMIVNTAFLSGARDAFAQEPPLPLYSDFWEEAGQICDEAISVYQQWVDREIGAADVAAAYPDFQDRYETLMGEVDQAIEAEYRYNAEDLGELRAETLLELQTSLEELNESNPTAP